MAVVERTMDSLRARSLTTLARRASFDVIARSMIGAAWLLMLAAVPAGAVRLQEQPPPRILLDMPATAVQYQLDRLTPAQLVQVERRDDDVRYRPVYVALLTRPGLAPEYRDEALAALSKLDGASPALVLLDLLAAAREDAASNALLLGDLLYALPAAALRAERDAIAGLAADRSAPESARVAAYGALLLADGDAGSAWELALETTSLRQLLLAAPGLPIEASGEVEIGLAERLILLLSAGVADPGTRSAAMSALAWARPDGATFRLLASEVISGEDRDAREAAVRALLAVPQSEWPGAAIEPLARALLARLSEMPLPERTEPTGADALQLADALVSRIPAETGDALREELRGLGVRVARIATIPERMAFDRGWLAVEAGRPVQIVFENADAMPHNLVVGFPGSLEVIGRAGASMPMPDDPTVRPFVPDLPIVLAATGLLAPGETQRLSFVAPEMPGAYVYVCTFPGHWMLMYGVMLVVPDLAAWEVDPQPPLDPLSGEPYPLDGKD